MPYDTHNKTMLVRDPAAQNAAPGLVTNRCPVARRLSATDGLQRLFYVQQRSAATHVGATDARAATPLALRIYTYSIVMAHAARAWATSAPALACMCQLFLAVYIYPIIVYKLSKHQIDEVGIRHRVPVFPPGVFLLGRVRLARGQRMDAAASRAGHGSPHLAPIRHRHTHDM